MTKSMRIALEDLKLERLWLVYPGRTGYPMGTGVQCVSLAELPQVRELLK